LPWKIDQFRSGFARSSSLRWGELTALRPEDIDLDARTVRVTRQLNKPGAVPSFGPPKSRAGRSIVVFASLIVPDLHKHLDALPQRRSARVHQP
jgi:integrase